MGKKIELKMFLFNHGEKFERIRSDDKIFHAFPKKALERENCHLIWVYSSTEGWSKPQANSTETFMAGICIYSFICNHNEAETNERTGGKSFSFVFYSHAVAPNFQKSLIIHIKAHHILHLFFLPSSLVLNSSIFHSEQLCEVLLP